MLLRFIEKLLRTNIKEAGPNYQILVLFGLDILLSCKWKHAGHNLINLITELRGQFQSQQNVG